MRAKQIIKDAATKIPAVRQIFERRDAAEASNLRLAEENARAQSEAQAARQEAVAATAALDRSVARLAETDLMYLAAAGRGEGTYRSCNWIEEGAFISKGKVLMCCMQGIGNSAPHLFDLGPDLGDTGQIILDKRKAIRLANQTSASPCRGCYELKAQEWKATDHLRFVAISGFLHCNLACSYCVSYKFDPKDRGDSILPQIKEWIDTGLLRRGSSIDFGGGESTIHREFNEIAELAFDNRIGMLIFTNATGVVPTIKKGLRLGLASVVCSVDAGTAESYRRIKGRPVLDKVWATLAEYAAISPEQVEAKYIVMESNCSRAEIDAFFARAQAAGVTRFIASVNSFQNALDTGELSGRVRHGIAYLLKRGNEIGFAKPADLLSPETERQIVELSKIADIETIAAALSKPNRSPLELAFSDSDTFLDRAGTLIRERDSFTIMLPAACAPTAAPKALRTVLGAMLPDDTRPDGPWAEFIIQAKETWGDVADTWGGKLRPAGFPSLRFIASHGGAKLIGVEVAFN